MYLDKEKKVFKTSDKLYYSYSSVSCSYDLYHKHLHIIEFFSKYVI